MRSDSRRSLVLVSVTAVGILFGGFAVLLAIPIAAVLATLVDVTVRGRTLPRRSVPTVLFPTKDAGAGSRRTCRGLSPVMAGTDTLHRRRAAEEEQQPAAVKAR